jgi:uncharacterized protein YbbK (DUF523 family)/uncharacterized protein YbgA (DUF1722 family)
VKPRIGVSACLLGDRVRYDGQDKRQPWAVDGLAERVEWVRVCPEVELGLGVPREPVRLEAGASGISLMTTKTRRDLSGAMRNWAAARLEALAAQGIDAYVLKARSPSCGLGTTPVVGSEQTRDGLFAEALRQRFPVLPVVDEEMLADAVGRSRFLRLAKAHSELRKLFQPPWTRGEIVDFHTGRKLLLMAHSPAGYERLGTLVARIAQASPEDFARDYFAGFLAALTEEPTPGRHANALSHAAGYVSHTLSPEERAALTAEIERVGAGETSALAPAKMCIVDRARRLGIDYLLRQVYLTVCESN